MDKKRVVEIARAIRTDVARYLFTVSCINCGLGIATGIAMYWLGMPNPVLWGMVGALMAVPILMVFKICCDHIESLAPVGEFLSTKHAEPIEH